jgi:hypothetical protein
MTAHANYELDFSGRLPVSAQQGMKKADDNACPDWRYMVDHAIVAVARKKAELTVDDVIVELGEIPHCPKNHSLDALGPAMCRAAKHGVLKSTGRRERSKRPEKNGNLHTVWASNYAPKGTP